MNRWITGAAVLAAAAATAGCSRPQETEMRQQVQGVRQQIGQATEGARQAATRAALATKVKSAIETRKGLDGTRIDVDVHGRHVTLKGDVRSPEQARLAEQTARETEGVDAVTSQLTMRVPATPPP